MVPISNGFAEDSKNMIEALTGNKTSEITRDSMIHHSDFGFFAMDY